MAGSLRFESIRRGASCIAPIHAVRSCAFAIGVLVLGCGGSSPPPEDARAVESPPSELEQLLAEEPESPLTRASVRAFRPTRTCAQGPDTVRFEALGARFSEDFEVHACVRHAVRGDYRVRIEGRADEEPRSFGYGSAENERCVATASERAAHAEEASPPASASHARAPRGRSGLAGRTTAAPPPPTLVEVDAAFENCPEGTYSVAIASHRFISYESAPIEASTPISVDLWSSEPNDLEGALFVVVQRAVPTSMTSEAFRAYDDAYREWVRRYAAYVDREVASGRSQIIDRTASTTDPPPAAPAETPPPRPSANATWVAGSWQHLGEWVFTPGFWRVPVADIEAGLTVQAPRTPPPPRREVPPTQPTATAVWTPGSWQWDGATYVWIAGAWRIPPNTGDRWQPSAWRVTASGASFVPGGWTLTIRH